MLDQRQSAAQLPCSQSWATIGGPLGNSVLERLPIRSRNVTCGRFVRRSQTKKHNLERRILKKQNHSHKTNRTMPRRIYRRGGSLLAHEKRPASRDDYLIHPAECEIDDKTKDVGQLLPLNSPSVILKLSQHTCEACGQPLPPKRPPNAQKKLKHFITSTKLSL